MSLHAILHCGNIRLENQRIVEAPPASGVFPFSLQLH